MQFNSLEFIFGFLPIFLIFYQLFSHKLRGIVLFAGSLVFYILSGGDNYWWAALLVIITLLSYFASMTLTKPNRGWLLGFYLTALTGILSFFKVFQGGKYLPAGMSFYLFQIAAYLIDVYKLKFLPERKILDYMNQIFLFPKLLSGPLMEPRLLKLQEKFCRPSRDDIYEGLEKFILGLGFKVLIANRLGGLWGQAATIGYASISTPFAWMALLAYAMRLYFDFYGYSLMAIGIGKMLGYDLPDNFLDPYASKTVSEFYRRWHVTLGAWFREYLYIPLGGNRKGMLRTILNLAVVWLFTGLWHGIGGNYLLWAGILFLLIVNERLWMGKLMKKSHVIGHVYTIFAILISWIPFAIGDWNQMIVFAGRLFGMCGETLNPRDFVIWGEVYLPLLTAGSIFATPLPGKLWKKIRGTTLAEILLFALFWVSVYFIATAAQDTFLYFQY